MYKNLIKGILVTITLLLSFSLSAQMKKKDYKNIMKSKNIYEINAFLRDAHPNDPRRSVLKPRVMQLMEDYIRTAHPADQRVSEMQEMIAMLKRRPSTKITFEEMNAIIKQKQIAKYKEELERKNNLEVQSFKNNIAYNTQASAAASAAGISNYVDSEADEFDLLMNENPQEHKDKTVKILNSLFDNDPTSKECSVLIENKSDCNIIMRFEGPGNLKYRLPIPSKGENVIVVEKGNYLLTSVVCGAQYASQKSVQKSIMVSLGNPGKPN